VLLAFAFAGRRVALRERRTQTQRSKKTVALYRGVTRRADAGLESRRRPTGHFR
jgi:hypothetical protein